MDEDPLEGFVLRLESKWIPPDVDGAIRDMHWKICREVMSIVSFEDDGDGDDKIRLEIIINGDSEADAEVLASKSLAF